MTNNADQLVELGFKLGGENRISSPKPYERRWASEWRAAKLFEAKPDPSKPKFFICVPYSYQNGPLHLGHGFTFTRGDVIARYKRMRGFNVLFPWAWHWTGEAVAGTSERLRRGDESVKKMLVEMDGVPEELLHHFMNPEFICAYYTAENRQVVDAMGWSVDWTREFYTTSLHPYYSNFIRWQYDVLRRKGLVAMGRHPVVWCPRCQSATGDHDRLRGEGIYPEEFTLVYFDVDGVKLAAATLRPETVYGVTNLWLNPETTYVVIERDGFSFLISGEAITKFREQWQNIVVSRSIHARELIGKTATAPLTGRKIPILPATFVDPSIGTGVVYSVPAHAPYDYMALRDLAENPELLSRFGLDKSIVSSIKPIKVVHVDGFGDFPAVEIVEKIGIKNQLDERLEDVTREIYSREFHSGVMVVDELKGLPVSSARKIVQDKLVENNSGSIFYDLAGKVVCRSGDECVVKIVEDQWFLTFSNAEWKQRVKNLISSMNIYPETVRAWFVNVVDWLKDWACTRKTGLGTNLPWDPSWKIETLSDSTIYPALYTVSAILNKNVDAAARLPPEVFDYVYLGLGDPDKIAKATNIDKSLLESMRREYLYWYGVDLRVSAKDLVPNHLTFYLFHHTAIFEPQHWPRGISVNGMINIEGQKMSKSKGNFIALKTAVQRHGADATRIALMMSSEDLDDPDWRTKNAEEAEQFIQNFLGLVQRVSGDVENSEGPADRWLLASLKISVKTVTEALEKMKTRTACNEVVYGMLNSWRWWTRRNNGSVTVAGRKFIEGWTLMLAPFAPFAAEEAWKTLGKQGFASVEKWPEEELSEEDLLSLVYEDVIKDILSDVREVLGIVKGTPKSVKLFTASEWKTSFARKLLKTSLSEALSWLSKTYPDKLKIGQKIAPKIVEHLRNWEEKCKKYTETVGFGDVKELLEEILSFDRKIAVEAAALLEQETKIGVQVLAEEEALQGMEAVKAANSASLKPAIYVETG
ncbi:MAG: leucine--tRNA ligase [Candidatus Caldarchaeum sp.]